MGEPDCYLKTDVLVIGGSTAALIAALEAKENDLDVLLVTKGQVGRGGNTIVSGAGFAAFLPDGKTSDSFERYQEDILSSGKGINQEDLVQVLVQNSTSVLEDLEGYGVEFLKNEEGYVRRTPPGHSCARQVPTLFDIKNYHTRGLSINLPLRLAAKQVGVKFLEKTSIVKLLDDSEGVCGAVGIDLTKENLLQIKAKAVVLATGGGGNIFESTNNTADVTGDGYTLALNVGAKLVDMELVQFYPTMGVKPLRVPISSPLFGDGAVLRNRSYERFLSRYDPAGDMATRDAMSRAIFYEVKAGNGVDGGVYIDFSAIPDQVLANKHRGFVEYMRRKGMNSDKDMVIVSPTTHFFMGGVKIDPCCRTGIDGLFAAGEVAGGLHGANRLSGNALTETVVFGKIAGSMAAQKARTMKMHRDVAGWGVSSDGYRCGRILEIRSALRRTMWQNVSVVRSQDSLETALADIDAQKKELEAIHVQGLGQLSEWMTVRSMLTVAEVVTSSASMRAESRGGHYREDFPATDDNNWFGKIEVCLHGTELDLKFHAKDR